MFRYFSFHTPRSASLPLERPLLQGNRLAKLRRQLICVRLIVTRIGLCTSQSPCTIRTTEFECFSSLAQGQKIRNEKSLFFYECKPHKAWLFEDAQGQKFRKGVGDRRAWREEILPVPETQASFLQPFA